MHCFQRRLAILAGALALVVTCANVTSAQVRQPNIVVIVGDDMGYADVGVHGCKDIPTPHLDSLAKNGVRCTNGYVSGPYCSPTRAGLLTGRYQQRFGHEFNPGRRRRPECRPAARPRPRSPIGSRRPATPPAWSASGTSAAATKFHPLKRGFDEFFGFLGGAHSYFDPTAERRASCPRH